MRLKFLLLIVLITQLKSLPIFSQQAPPMRILALFSGTNNDLGIDHRLGRQVLKLALNKAKQLRPNVQVELIVQSDDADCTSLNTIPNQVASHYYLARGVCESNEHQCESLEEIGLEGYFNESFTRSKRSPIQAPKWKQKVDAILGPSCDFLVDLVARMAAYWRTPIYSVTSVGASFSKKDIYSTLTRLSPSIDHLAMFMVRSLQMFKWRHLSVLVDTREVENGIIFENLERMIVKTRYLWPIERKIFHLDSRTLFETDSLKAELGDQFCGKQIREALVGASRVARVFLLLFSEPQVIRRILLCAHELRMNNGEFVFLALNLGLKTARALPSGTENEPAGESVQKVKSNGQRSGSQSLDWFASDDERNNLIARQMFESLLVFSAELPMSDEFNLFVEQTLDMSRQEYPKVRFERASVGSAAAALHDSLLLAVEAQHRRNLNLTHNSAQQAAPDDEEGEQDFKRMSAPLMWGEHFSGGLIASMHINENGDQELDYVLNDLEPEMGVMRPVASYSKETRQIQMVPSTYIHWPMRVNSAKGSELADEPPPDEPECGFTGEAERCVDRQNLYAVLSILAVLFVLALVSIVVSRIQYKRIKYQQQLDDFWWKIRWEDLQFIQVSDSLISSTPGGVVRALKSGTSIISGDASEVGSMISVSRSRVTINSRPKPQQPQNVNPSGREDPKKSGVPLIVTTSELEEKDKNADNQTVLSATRQSSFAVGSCVIKSEFSSFVRCSTLAMYKNDLVIVKRLNGNALNVSRDLLVELRSMREHINENLAKFVGLCVEPRNISVVYEYCSRGNLQDILMNSNVAMDWTLKYSIIGDIVNGLNFIHTTLLDYHGRLKSTNLVLDSRFTVKLTDFGLQSLYSQIEPIKDNIESDLDEDETNEGAGKQRLQADARSLCVTQSVYNMESVSMRGANQKTSLEPGANIKNRGAARFFWMAPEHLREKEVHLAGSKKGDVYALAIIFCEIFTRKEPYFYGTNAKPLWSAIKRHRPVVKSTATRGCDASEVSASRSVIGAAGTEQNKARGRGHARSRIGKRGSASIAPAVFKDAIGEGVETGSLVAQKESEEAEEEQLSTIQSSKKAQTNSTAQSNQRLDADEILDQIRMGIMPEPVRPYMPNYVLQEVNPKLVELMRDCWSEVPANRPALQQVRNQLRRITKGVASKNYLDNLLDRLQTYAAELERIVDGKSSDILEEKFRTEELLYQLVPKFVADRLKRNEHIIPQVFDGVTIFFSDIIGFEKYASVMSPSELVDLLNSIYSAFDSIISSFDVTKIETIIDQFLVASGISLQQEEQFSAKPIENQPEENAVEESEQQQTSEENIKRKKKSIRSKLKLTGSLESSGRGAGDEPEKSSNPQANRDQAGGLAARMDKSHYKRSSAEQVARMALCIRDLVKSLQFRQNLCTIQKSASLDSSSAKVQQFASNFNIRIGIHSGKVCAGIVGVKRPKFCLIGDTVNVASRMHTNSKANKIQISGDTRQLLEQVPGFSIEPRGKIEVKGKGLMETYWLESSY